MCRAIVVVGHGSRNTEACVEFLTVVEMLRSTYSSDLVLHAYLEMNDPRLDAALVSALEQGHQEILVVPCLLFRGAHVERDIPAVLRAFAQSNPGTIIRMARAIGADPLLLKILKEGVEEIA
jgi:sirohydrochlorin cobaltochelatase